VNIVSSQRVKTQIVTCIFSKGAHSEFLPPRLSRCTCESGKYICSHLITFIMIIFKLQTKLRNYSFDDIIRIIPPTVILTSSLRIPISLVSPLPGVIRK
jgi:hypothetical protein